MGSFGLNISKKYIAPPASAYKANNQPKGFVVQADEEARDGAFQKSLAYSSYYVMVFVTICMFMPAHVAQAAQTIESVLPL